MFWVFLSPKQSFAFLFLLGGVFFVALAPHGMGMGIGIGKGDREVWALGGGFLRRLARVCKETQRKRERARERKTADLKGGGRRREVIARLDGRFMNNGGCGCGDHEDDMHVRGLSDRSWVPPFI